MDYGAPWDYKKDGHREYEAFGNFNFGATGRALGFFESELTGFAGLAGLMKGTGEIRQNGLPFLSPRNGDNAIDQYWIREGIKYYDSRY